MGTTFDTRTSNGWRRAGAPYTATCAGFGLDHCDERATFCNTWQTLQMAAPAFYYYCDTHALRIATTQGIDLSGEIPTNPYRVGAVWHTSWGYDQTNVEYYQVVRESKASVWLAPMGSTVKDGRLYPTVTTGLSDAVRMHRKPRNAYGVEHPYLTLDSVRSAWPYDGGGKYDTRAAGEAGH